jgi:hypothetical protein
MRSYPKADEEEGKRLFDGQEISLKPPKLWPRHTLLEMLSREPVKDIKGVCTEEFVITLLEKKWLMYAGVQLMAQLTLHLAFLALLCAVVVLRAVPEGGEGGQWGAPSSPSPPPLLRTCSAWALGPRGTAPLLLGRSSGALRSLWLKPFLWPATG